MKSKLFLTLISLAICLHPFAQTSYFQQQVDYKIDVTLDDEHHLLQGWIEMEYTNNSTQTLDKIYMHLWPNAYKNDKSAFAKQQLKNNKRSFHFSEKKDRGYLSGLNFTVNGTTTVIQEYEGNPDIVLLTLPQPLAPHQKISIKTPFTLKIPKVFSRLGHTGQNYFITQWYPKPAVFDTKGWHPIPYLDQGEFYSEFGNFDVKITLPANYVVASTGTTTDDTEFFNNRVSLTTKLLANADAAGNWKASSSEGSKTLHYHAENVHDFAWFASKEFMIVKDTARLEEGNQLPVYGYFLLKNKKNWARSAFYVKRAVEYRSRRIGDYPWPHASAVDGDLIAGGGMEYPMVTVISAGGSAQSLDNVIEHEVGHNWFYGILASNERDDAWMDEGINSYYEADYMTEYYKPKNEAHVQKKRPRGFSLDESLISSIFMKRKLDQPLSLTSAEFINVNYGLDVYKKTARYFKILELYLGTKSFDAAMKEYYRQWSFKHPYPDDLKQVLEKSTGKNLSWLFDDLIQKNMPVDYKIVKASNNSVTIKNIAGNPTPLNLTVTNKNGSSATYFYEGFKDVKSIDQDMAEVKSLTIDADNYLMDASTSNNYYHTSGICKASRPWTPKIFGLIEQKDKNVTNILPAIGWNLYDKFMAGILISNPILPGRNFRYFVAPMIATSDGSVVGQGMLEQNFYSYKNPERLAIGISGRRYAFNFIDNSLLKERLHYIKVTPYITAEFNRWHTWAHKLTYKTNILVKDQVNIKQVDGAVKAEVKADNQYIHTLDYTLTTHNGLSPMEANIRLEQQNYNSTKGKEHYLKLSLEYNTKLYYNTKRSVDIRIFAGGYLDNTAKISGATNSDYFARGSMSLASTAADDYLFECPYLGRSADQGFFSRQIDISDGGFKFPLAYKYGQFGYTNSFLAALNLKAGLPVDMPLKLPIKPYFDLGYYNDLRPINSDKNWKDNVVWAGGFMLDFGSYVGIYFPVVQSKSLSDQYNQSVGANYLSRISFSIKLPQLRISELVKSFSF